MVLSLRLAAACFLLAASSAAAAPLTVATDAGLAPFSFVENDKAVGIDIDVMNEAAARAKEEIAIVPLPWKRVLSDVENGAAPLGMAMFRTPEREAFGDFQAPVHFTLMGLFTAKGKAFDYKSVADLHGKRLGVNRGFAIQDDLDQAIKDGKVLCEEANTTEQNIAKLVAGRIDAFAANLINTKYVVRGLPERESVMALPNLIAGARPAFLVASKKAQFDNKDARLATLKKALEAIHTDGTFDKIVAKYVQ